MKTLAEKLSGLLPQLTQRGAVFLFALFDREDVAGLNDLILSSEWSDENSAAAVRTLSNLVVPLLDRDELTALSRVVVIPSSEKSVAALALSRSVDNGIIEVRNSNFMGLQINHAYIFRAQSPPVPRPAANAA